MYYNKNVLPVIYEFLFIHFILGLVGKKWSIYRVSPLWNLHFSTKYLKSISEQLKKYLTSNLKKQKHSFSQMSVEIEAKEVQEECIALKVIK